LRNSIIEKHLQTWEEITGVCYEIKVENKEKIAIYLKTTAKTYKIFLPCNLFERQLEKLIKEVKGKKIGILRTDDPSKPYVIRIVEKRKHVKTHVCSSLQSQSSYFKPEGVER
jgi:hypothetical protein